MLYGNTRVQPNPRVRAEAEVTILLECSDSLFADVRARVKGFINRWQDKEDIFK